MIPDLRRKLVILFLVGCFILTSVPTALCRSPAPIIYVSGDGSGDFSCDGIQDNVQINQALKFVAENPGYTTVHLKGPFKYVIDDTLLIGSNTILEGDSTAVIKLANHVGWSAMKPLIQQMSSLGNDNIIVRGFEVDVNYAGNSEIAFGRGYYNVIYFLHCNNVKVYNMYMHDGMGDGLRISQGKNIQFYNNRIYKLGHDGLYAIGCENVEAWNNKITCRINSGLRIGNSNHVKFHDNLIESFYHWSAGGPGILIEKTTGIVDDVEVYNNTINNTYGPGIWLVGYGKAYPKDEAKNVHIHHNIFYSTGTNPSINWVGGIIASGFYDTLIENNVFDGIYHAAISNSYPLVSTGVNPGIDITPKGTGYTTIVRNNIIVNTQKRTKDPTGTGYGVMNYHPETHSFVLENNCIYNNVGGNYKNLISTTDIYLNPLLADQKNHNYHLQSVSGRWTEKTWVQDKVSSPCIDAGYRYSDYSNEPVPNGNRINIGPDGNTIHASKSAPYPPSPTLPTANFGCNITSGYAPLSIQFTDLSKDAISRKWNFGDGAISTQQNPMHTYSAAGSYTVTLTVSNENGTDSKTNNINVKPAVQKPVPSFSSSVTTGYAPLSVSFTDRSTGSPTSWKWIFGDGTSSTAKNPAHTFSKAGKYNVSLTVTNAAGSNKVTKSSYIVVSPLKAPVAAISASPTSGKAPLTVTFTDKSAGSPKSWSWNFGDKITSTAKNNVHKYSKAGKYTVSLTVKNAIGSNTKTMSITVQ
jgi:PKD repeat protein